MEKDGMEKSGKTHHLPEMDRLAISGGGGSQTKRLRPHVGI